MTLGRRLHVKRISSVEAEGEIKRLFCGQYVTHGELEGLISE